MSVCFQLDISEVLHRPSMHSPRGLASCLCYGSTANHNYNCYCTLGNVQQLGLENREAKGSNDKIGKDSETSNDQRGSDLQHDLVPDDWINDSLKHLILVRFVLNVSLVSSDSFNKYALLVFCKALCFHWGVGQPPSNKTGPSHGNVS